MQRQIEDYKNIIFNFSLVNENDYCTFPGGKETIKIKRENCKYTQKTINRKTDTSVYLLFEHLHWTRYMEIISLYELLCYLLCLVR